MNRDIYYDGFSQQNYTYNTLKDWVGKREKNFTPTFINFIHYFEELLHLPCPKEERASFLTCLALNIHRMDWLVEVCRKRNK